MKRIGVFAGSFDPVTVGHIDIIKRALGIFDSVHVLVGENMDGKKHMYDTEKRLSMLKAATARFGEGRVECEIWGGPIFMYCEKVGASHIIKGVRNSADFEYEKLLALQTKVLCPGVETLLLISEHSLEHISSSYVRGMIGYGMDVVGTVPDEIIEML